MRIVRLTDRKVTADLADATGVLQALSDEGLLVQRFGERITLYDGQAGTAKKLESKLDLGSRGKFRNAREVVFVSGAEVHVVDVTALR